MNIIEGAIVLTPDGVGIVVSLVTRDELCVGVELENSPYTFSPVYYWQSEVKPDTDNASD